jgi:hypothetical protein
MAAGNSNDRQIYTDTYRGTCRAWSRRAGPCAGCASQASGSARDQSGRESGLSVRPFRTGPVPREATALQTTVIRRPTSGALPARSPRGAVVHVRPAGNHLRRVTEALVRESNLILAGEARSWRPMTVLDGCARGGETLAATARRNFVRAAQSGGTAPAPATGRQGVGS